MVNYAHEQLAAAVRSRRIDVLEAERELRRAEQARHEATKALSERQALLINAERELLAAVSGYRWDPEVSGFTMDGVPVDNHIRAFSRSARILEG